MTGKILIISAGLFTSVQSTKRHHWSQYGVPISGPMDEIAAKLANQLVGNAATENVIEITFNGPKLKFDQPTLVAITGADLSPKINNQDASLNKALLIFSGDSLSFGKPKYGVRAYLSVKGGVSGNASVLTQPLTNNEELNYQPSSEHRRSSSSVSPAKHIQSSTPLSVLPGPEFQLFTQHQQQQLLTNSYKIMPESNRMGIRLQGDSIRMDRADQLTSPVLPGTVQMPPSGVPIVLMKDCQTTGGYPRMLQLTDGAIAELSQRVWGSEIRFAYAN